MDYIKRLLENRKRDKRIVAWLSKTNGKGQADVARFYGMHRQQVNVIWKKSKSNGQGNTDNPD